MRITGIKPDASRQQRRMIPTMMHCTLGQFRKGGVAEYNSNASLSQANRDGLLGPESIIFFLDCTGVKSLPVDWELLPL